MSKVRLEVLPALAETLGIDNTSDEVISNQEGGDDRSVRELLNRLAIRHQRFGQIVFDINTQKLSGRVIIFVNGCDLELLDGLETKVNDGDTLTFVPLIEGG